LVTGNNKKSTISEFKTADYGSLKASLCTLYLHLTDSFLIYSLSQNGVNHYLKKIHWEENRKEILEKEFDMSNAFSKVVCLSFPKSSSLIPSSFLTIQKEDNKAYIGKEEVKDSILTSTLNTNESLVFSNNYNWEDIVNSTFPECIYLTSFTPFIQNIEDPKYSIFVSTSGNRTHLVLKEKSTILLSQLYITETETETLYFILGVLNAHKIEDQSLCSLHLLCESNETEIHESLGEYFENISLGSNKSETNFPFSLQDKIDFSIVLNAAKCAL
jgi:hypothetical protein